VTAGRHRKIMRLLCAGIALVVLVLSPVALAAMGKPGRLAPVGIVELIDGRTVVATETTLYAYLPDGHLPDGRLDRHFGDGGGLAPFAPANRRVIVKGIAVDQNGRIVFAGAAYPKSPIANTDEPTSYAAIERYLPSGNLDTELGSNGAVVTDFGFPPPARPARIPDYAKVLLPINVEATGVAVDPRGRIVIAGTRAATYTGTKYGTLVSVPEAFVARLGAGGDQDPSFNGTGTLQLPGVASIGRPAPSRGGGVYFMAYPAAPEYSELPPSPVLGHLRDNGAPDPSFGQGGWRPTPADPRFGSEFDSEITLDPQGRLLLFGQMRGPSVLRLGPNGSVDQSFGHGGAAILASPNAEVELGGLATTHAGSVLVAGTLSSESTPGRRSSRLLLARLTSKGRLEKRFGRGGMVTTAFHAKSGPEGQAVLIDRGRALVGGTAGFGDRDLSHFVLARYLLGH
jgi:uncharacterized delta-60 repeat protein